MRIPSQSRELPFVNRTRDAGPNRPVAKLRERAAGQKSHQCRAQEGSQTEARHIKFFLLKLTDASRDPAVTDHLDSYYNELKKVALDWHIYSVQLLDFGIYSGQLSR